MSRRGARLVLVAALGLLLWMMTGADGAGASTAAAGEPGAGVGPSTEELAVHLAGGVLGGRTATLVPLQRNRSGSAARAQRLVTVVAVLVGGALALRPLSPSRNGHLALPVWSGWFTDPGRLRGPPAV